MDEERYCAWLSARHGLSGERRMTPEEALAQAGWQRSVGGVSPYLALYARTGMGREAVDALAAELRLYELPSARACTYVLPAAHFALGLTLAHGQGTAAEMRTARGLGVTDAEIDRLKEQVLDALAAGKQTPDTLKTAVGEAVRNLGEAGKKKGLTTTLPLALGALQEEGRIRRVPLNGRFDTQRYAYELWAPPIGELPDEETAATEVARLYFGWMGAATLAEFCDFAAFSRRSATAATARAGVVPFGPEPDLLGLPGAWESYCEFEMSDEPTYRLVGSMDSYVLLRRGRPFWLRERDAERPAPTEKGLKRAADVAELTCHAILDRGRLVGLWLYDSEAGELVWHAWGPRDAALRAQVAKLEAMVRAELSDVRSFSLDSPASRQPRVAALRELAAGER